MRNCLSIVSVVMRRVAETWEYVYRISSATGCIVRFFVFVSLLFGGVCEAQTEQARHILILNSYHKEFEWTDNQTSAIKEVLTREIEDLELYVEYMDTKRIYSPEYLEHLYHIFRLKYSLIKLDGIIATDDNALRFVMKYHEEIFSGAPVSFCGINDYHPAMFDGKDAFTGLIEVLDIKGTIDLAMKLHEDIRTVYVITDNTPTGIGQQKDVEAISKEYKEVAFEYLSGRDYSHSELLEKLRVLPKNSVVLLTVWLRDKNNIYIPVDEGGNAISSASTVPVYGIITMYLGHGLVGGKLLSSRAQGSNAVELLLRVLGGEKPADIGVIIESVNPYMFDFTQLQRWDIDKSNLPADSIILNKPRSLYYRYRRIIWVGITIVIVQSGLIIALFMTMALRKKAEAEILIKSEQLKSYNLQLISREQQLKASNQQLIVNEREREKLLKTLEAKNEELQSIVYISSHDLKSPLVNIDGFSAMLTESCKEITDILCGLDLTDEVMQRILPLTDNDIPESLHFIAASTSKMKMLLEGLLQVSRVGTQDICIKPLDMNKLIQNITNTFAFQIKEKDVSLTVDDLPDCIGDVKQINQVFSNIIDNALKYLIEENKGSIKITGEAYEKECIYCIEDNGIGIHPDHQKKVFELFHRLNPDDSTGGQGLGLTITTRALSRNGGWTWVESEPGKGSKFFISLPTAQQPNGVKNV